MNIGTKVGPYRIDGLLGKDAAEVWKAWHSNLHCHHALKMLPLQMTFDKNLVERFLSEARNMAGLQHPNIATIHTVSEAECPQPYFAMELIEGCDLSDLLAERGVLPLSEALPILQQIGAALDYAHSRSLIHREVKPGNVLLKADGHGGHAVKVVDFGIARAQEESGGKGLTKTGMIVSTPEYMSPEQGGSGAIVDHHTDLYSLGVIAYEMLCGQPPFRASGETSTIAVIVQHVRDEPRPPREYSPTLSQGANSAILKALAKNPIDRFESCDAFVHALSSTAPIVVPKPKVATKKISRTVPILIGAALLAGVALVGLGTARKSMNAQAPLSADGTEAVSSEDSAVAPLEKPELVNVTVPEVVGKSEQQAKEIIKAKSLVADVMTGNSNAFEAQQVMSQYPPVGSQIAKGASVRIRISIGPGASEQSEPIAPVVTAPQSASSWTTYRDSRRGWNMEYPTGWTPSEKYFAEDDRTRVEFVGPAPFVSIIMDVSPDSSGQSPLQSWQEMNKRFRRVHGERYKLIDISESPLGGRPGARWAFTLRKRSEPRLKKIDRGTTYSGFGYALLFVAPAGEFAKYQSIFDQAYLSFRFNGES